MYLKVSFKCSFFRSNYYIPFLYNNKIFIFLIRCQSKKLYISYVKFMIFQIFWCIYFRIRSLNKKNNIFLLSLSFNFFYSGGLVVCVTMICVIIQYFEHWIGDFFMGLTAAFITILNIDFTIFILIIY